MKISIVGSGYVGLTTGVALASLGHKVICVDKDEPKIEKLKSGVIPIYEPGLEEMLNTYKFNIRFTSDLSEAVQESEVIFICVGILYRKDCILTWLSFWLVFFLLSLEYYKRKRVFVSKHNYYLKDSCEMVK